MKPYITIIAAIDEERGLGKNNQLLVKISDDLKRFKRITRGHPVIMGRKTYESIGKPLPNRLNIVVTHNSHYEAGGVIIVDSIDRALQKAKDHDSEEIFIIGGADIYRQALPYVDKLYLTLVKGRYGADVFFPDYSMFTREVSREEHVDGDRAYTFLELKK